MGSIFFRFIFSMFSFLSAGDFDNSLNTASHISYLSELEKEVIFELNKVRSNPEKYAKEYLVPLESFYIGKKFYYPDQLPIETHEGRKALAECIRFLTIEANPASPLKSSKGLWLAAKDHVEDQSGNGKVGHIGKDQSNFSNRIERYGEWEVAAAENISYGNTEAQQIVISLLIDDGIKSRGHRTNILNPSFKVVGVSCGNHPQYGKMCVMDFAGGFKNKK